MIFYFRFDGRTVQLEYTFSCFDESEAEAESFSAYCVRCVRKELEAFGCKLGKIECKAEEADTSWLDRLEDSIFGPQKSATPDMGTHKSPALTGKKRPGTER